MKKKIRKILIESLRQRLIRTPSQWLVYTMATAGVGMLSTPLWIRLAERIFEVQIKSGLSDAGPFFGLVLCALACIVALVDKFKGAARPVCRQPKLVKCMLRQAFETIPPNEVMGRFFKDARNYVLHAEFCAKWEAFKKIHAQLKIPDGYKMQADEAQLAVEVGFLIHWVDKLTSYSLWTEDCGGVRFLNIPCGPGKKTIPFGREAEEFASLLTEAVGSFKKIVAQIESENPDRGLFPAKLAPSSAH